MNMASDRKSHCWNSASKKDEYSDILFFWFTPKSLEDNFYILNKFQSNVLKMWYYWNVV